MTQKTRIGRTRRLIFSTVLLAVGLCPCLLAAQGTPTAPVPAVVQKTNVLNPNDVILVKVYQEPDMETRASIDRDGLITLPLLGTLQVTGKTPEQAANLIQDLYGRDYLVNPRVSLTLLEHARLRFTVMGQVQRPGSYEFPSDEPLNLLQAIAMAGGYTRMSAPSRITLQRIQNGQPALHALNGEQMKSAKTQPFQVLPDDIITVGERIF